MKNLLHLATLTAFLSLALIWSVGAQSLGTIDFLNFNLSMLAALVEPLDDPDDPPGFFQVKPQEFDPGKTNLVQAEWLNGIGCPTNGFIQNFPSGTTPYTDGACQTGDARGDRHNQGLLLVKTGPTNNFASAIAELKKVKGITLTELGYDLRKPGGTTVSPSGSHCGAGAPRFNVVTTDGVTHFVACNSPPPLVTNSSAVDNPTQATTTPLNNGWMRLRWDAALLAAAFPPILPTDVVKRIVIVFDEGQDAAGSPDFFGAAILDNIDVNGTLVGRGATDAD